MGMGNNSVRIAISIVGALVLALVGAWFYLWVSPAPRLAPPSQIAIEKGESFRSVARRLKGSGVVRSSTALLIYGELTGKARRIQPGDYEFKGGERISDVMRHLVNGDFVSIIVTIPEGLTVHQIAERIAMTGLVCQPEFEDAAHDGPLVRALGLMPLGAEGYLFPATYKFSPRAKVRDVLSAMLMRFFQVLTPQAEERMFQLGLTPRELVTMASIIEKEAKIPGDRKLIASVFYNRLRLGMPLQSDPTAEYSFAGESQSAAAAVRVPSTFNTYSFAGLPPGPIANPGAQSIEAALYPAKSNYLYFVARDDGSHVFSKSYPEHQKAIAMLRRTAMHDAPRPSPSSGRTR
jgi:peptidoglycan lytic transglycosylase G